MESKLLFSMADINIKGEVRVIAHREGELIYDHSQPNLWLDEGTRRLGNSMKSGNTEPYLCLSSNTVAPAYTDVNLPGVSISSRLWPVQESSYRRWKFQASYLAPAVGSVRNINSVGISNGSAGESAYCYTVLTTPLVQDDKTTLTVFYYVYVTTSRQNFGYGNTINSMLYSQLFANSSKQVNCRLYSDIGLGDVLPDESLQTLEEYNWYASLLTSVVAYDWTNFRYDTGVLSLGGISDLSSWAAFGWTAIGFDDFGPIKRFPFSTLGRVWGKKYRTTSGSALSPVSFYDLNNPTVGYMKAIQVRAKEYPYSPVDINRAKFTVYVDAGPNISDIAGIDTALYWIQKEDYLLRPAVTYRRTSEYTETKYCAVTHAEVLYNKYGGRNICIYSSRKDWDTQNRTFIENMDSYGGSISIGDTTKSLYPIYDTVSDYFDRIFVLDSRGTQRNIYAYKSSDGLLTSIVEEFIATAPHVVHHAIMLDNKEILLWHRTECKVSVLDSVSKLITSSWISVPNVFLPQSAITDPSSATTAGYRSWGDYIPNSDEVVLCADCSVLVMDRIGSVDKNQFNGISNFNTYTISNWSTIQNKGGSFRLAGGSLFIRLNGGEAANTSFYPSFLAQRIYAGAFEVTTIVRYDPRGSDQKLGLVALTPPTNNQFNHKDIFLNRTTTALVAESLNTTAGVTTLEVASAIKSGLVNTANLAISSNGAYWAGTGTNPERAWTSSNDYWYGYNSTNTAWKFNVPTVINKYVIVQPTDKDARYQFYSWSFEGSFDGSTWVYLDGVSSQDWYPSTQGFKNTRYITNTVAYSYYRFSGYDTFYRAPSSSAGHVSSIELHYEAPEVVSQNILESVRLKLVRDANNVVRTYYSISSENIPDFDAEWNQVGSDNYTLAGDVYVGIAGYVKEQSHQTKIEYKVIDFRINAGEVDRRVNSIYLEQNVVNDCRRVSKHGSAIKLQDELLSVMTRKGIVLIDTSDYSIFSSRNHVGNLWTKCGYFHDNEDASMASAFIFSNSSSDAYDQYQEISTSSSSSGVLATRILAAYIYEPVTRSWASQMYPLPVSDSISSSVGNFASALMYKDHIIAFNSGNLQDYWNGWNYVYLGCSAACFELDYTRYSWDTVYDKWVRVDWVSGVTPKGRPAHLDWRDIPAGIQLRCASNPLSAILTFANTDRYEFGAVKNGFIKDNQQYITGLRLLSYYADARQVVEEYDLEQKMTYYTGAATDPLSGDTNLAPDSVKWASSGGPKLITGALQFTAGVSSYCISNFGLVGDFDLQIDVPKMSNSTGTGWLGLRVKDINTGHTFGVYQTEKKYSCYANQATGAYVGTRVNTTDVFGKFRITRQGNVFTGYYWNNVGGSWIAFSAASTLSWNNVRIELYGSSPAENDRLNNLILNSGTVTGTPSTVIDTRSAHLDKWIRADFGGDAEFYFKDKVTNYHSYFSSYLLNQNIIISDDASSFRSDSTELAKGYNFYLGNYIRLNGEIRKIVSYDSYDKLFTCDPFSVQPSVGDKFDIISPAAATLVSSIYSDTSQTNKLVASALDGKLSVCKIDLDKKLELSYVYLLRSW